MRKRFVLIWAVFALLVSVHISGCSLIGFGLGSAIDSSRPIHVHPGTREQLFKLSPGAMLSLHREDGSTVVGIYRGLVAEPDSAYVLRYGAWRDTARLDFRPPRIGEPIRLVHGGWNLSSSKATVEFLGFPDRFVCNLAFGGKDMRDCWLMLSGLGKIAKVRWPAPGQTPFFRA